MAKGYNMFFKEEDYKKWEQFCEKNFKTKRVLSKIMTEAMEEYIENYIKIKRKIN